MRYSVRYVDAHAADLAAGRSGHRLAWHGGAVMSTAAALRRRRSSS